MTATAYIAVNNNYAITTVRPTRLTDSDFSRATEPVEVEL